MGRAAKRFGGAHLEVRALTGVVAAIVLALAGCSDGPGNGPADAGPCLPTQGECPASEATRCPAGDVGCSPGRDAGAGDAGSNEAGAICEPGAPRCGGETFMTCNAEGTGFEPEMLTPVATLCGDGTCLVDADCGSTGTCPRPDLDTIGQCKYDATDAGAGDEPDPYGRCDFALGDEQNPDCPIPGSLCNGDQCTPRCANTDPGAASGPGDDCPEPLSGTAETVCYFGLCALNCAQGQRCPAGMQCGGQCRWPPP